MHTKFRSLAGLGAIGMLMAVGTGITHAQETINSNGWYKACSDQGENKICNVQYQAVASTGQVITSINLAEITGSLQKRVFQVTVPTGRMIPQGMKVKIGEAEEKTVPFSFCTPQICAAEQDLTDDIVAQLKAGGEMKLMSVNWQGKENPLSVPLEGFTEAFDGEPIGQQELAERQKKLEDQLKAKSDDLLDKLKKAQEEARTNGGTAQ